VAAPARGRRRAIAPAAPALYNPRLYFNPGK